jgi:hypothetical protein
MRDPAPDLNLQLLILAGMFALAVGMALWIEMRQQRKDDDYMRKLEEQE